MNKNHKYISGIGMQYYWYGCMYIRMQEQTGLMPPYALIQTTQTPFTDKEFEELEARDVLKEIEFKEFLKAHERAVEIVDLMVHFPLSLPSHSQINSKDTLPIITTPFTRVQDRPTPDHDGLYLVVIKKQQECLNVWKYQKVVECFMNKWVLQDEDENVIAWMNLPDITYL